MNLRGLVSVSGKPGLYKVIGKNKNGFILESLDGLKTKLVVSISASKLATLEDITIFGENTDLKLIDILERIKTSDSTPPDSKSDGKILRAYFREVAPDHDEEKVYASDMKKILTWYSLIKEMPLFDEEPAATPASAVAETEKPGE